jgi:hypothetical protein
VVVAILQSHGSSPEVLNRFATREENANWTFHSFIELIDGKEAESAFVGLQRWGDYRQ